MSSCRKIAMTSPPHNNRNDHLNLFGMPFDSLNKLEITHTLDRLINVKSPSLVVTPNVDHFIRWQNDLQFQQVYSTASLRILDGMPLVWLAKLLGHRDAKRLAGVDFTDLAIEFCYKQKIPFALIGGTAKVNELAKAKLSAQYPAIKLFCFVSPSPLELFDDFYLDKLAMTLQEHKIKVVALCLGSPKQEKVYLELESRGCTGVFLAVGATVDFLAGGKKRAPKVIQSLGLEWCFRLFQEPSRLIKRYFLNALEIAPFFARAVFLVSSGKGKRREHNE